jgi:N-methylhydantoinase B
MEIGGRDDLEFACNAIFDRVTNPPHGREGGGDGAPGRVALKSGQTLRPKGFQIIPNGERLILELPGGGGMGDPKTRDRDLVARDLRDELITPEQAKAEYGV